MSSVRLSVTTMQAKLIRRWSACGRMASGAKRKSTKSSRNISAPLMETKTNRVVLDTNCLIASLSQHSEFYPVWKGFQTGKYILCVSNEILNEYQEIIERKTSAAVARNVISLLLKSRYVELINPFYRLNLIDADNDDNKFVDCAFAANAAFIVSDDKHFDVLNSIEFPKVLVLKLVDFLKLLQSTNPIKG